MYIEPPKPPGDRHYRSGNPFFTGFLFALFVMAMIGLLVTLLILKL